MWMTPPKDIGQMLENQTTNGTPDFFTSSNKKSSNKKRKMEDMQEDPDWCWVREQQDVNGQPVMVKAHNLTKRLKKIVKHVGPTLVTIDRFRKKARYHKERMNQNLLVMYESSRNVSHQLWRESDSSETEE